MPASEFDDLIAAHRDTTRDLRTLISQLRQSPSVGDLTRVVQPLAQAVEPVSETLAGRGAGGLAQRAGAEAARLLEPRLTGSRRLSLSGQADAGRAGPAGSDSPQVSATRTLIAEGPGGARGATSVQGARAGSAFPGAAAGSRIEEALNQTARAARDLSQILTLNTVSVENHAREFSRLAQGLLAGLTGVAQQGGGFGGFLRSGFGVVSLGLRIARLFRRDRREQEVISPFELPPSLAIEAANTDRTLSGFPRVDRGQRGEIRVIRPEPPAVAQPQVIVNVSAMDTQSFLDRSNDIARAVREAMLHMHPVNDVIGEI